MIAPVSEDLTIESEPDRAEIRFLEEKIFEFNVQTTGISDGELFGVFLRAADGSVLGGAHGWTWGGTCHIRHVFVPASMRRKGYGTRLLNTVETEARTRRCDQIVLETHDYQAPVFYEKLGFRLTCVVDQYPRGHQYMVFVKRLGTA